MELVAVVVVRRAQNPNGGRVQNGIYCVRGYAMWSANPEGLEHERSGVVCISAERGGLLQHGCQDKRTAPSRFEYVCTSRVAWP